MRALTTLFHSSSLLALALTLGCSSAPGDHHDAGDLPDGSMDSPDAAAPLSCAGEGLSCGVVGSGDSALDCGACRFTRTALASDGAAPAIVAAATGLIVAYVTPSSTSGSSDISITREIGRGNFIPDHVETVSGALANDTPPSIDSASPWLTYSFASSGANNGQIRVANHNPGSWVIENVAMGNDPRIVTAGTDEAHIAYVYVRTLANKEVHHAFKQGNGAWQDEIVESGLHFVSAPAIAIEPMGTVHVLYIGDQGLRHAARSPVTGSYKLETVDSSASINGATPPYTFVNAVVDGQGRLHATWPGTSGLSSGISYGRLYADAWNTSTLSRPGDYARAESSLAVDSKGRARVAYYSAYGARIALQGSSGAWANDALLHCRQPPAGIAVEADGRISVVSTCRGLNVLSLSGTYPDGYRQNCDAFAKQICDQSCNVCGASEPPSSGNQCLVGDSLYERFGSNSFGCQDNALAHICGDAFQDPSLVTGCQGVFAQATCKVDSSSGGHNFLSLPSPCDQLPLGNN